MTRRRSYVAGTIDVAVLEKGKARILDNGDLDSHRQNAEQALQHLGTCPEAFKEAAAVVPKPDK